MAAPVRTISLLRICSKPVFPLRKKNVPGIRYEIQNVLTADSRQRGQSRLCGDEIEVESAQKISLRKSIDSDSGDFVKIETPDNGNSAAEVKSATLPTPPIMVSLTSKEEEKKEAEGLEAVEKVEVKPEPQPQVGVVKLEKKPKDRSLGTGLLTWMDENPNIGGPRCAIAHNTTLRAKLGISLFRIHLGKQNLLVDVWNKSLENSRKLHDPHSFRAHFLTCMPIVFVGLACQVQPFCVIDFIHDSLVARVDSVVSGAVNFCSALYAGVGLFGYVAFYSRILHGDVLIELEASFFTQLLKMTFLFSVAVSIPLMMFPARSALFNLVLRPATCLDVSASVWSCFGRVSGCVLAGVFICLRNYSFADL